MRRLAILALIAAATLTGCSASMAHDGGASPSGAAPPAATPTAGPGQTLVSVLGDSHSGEPDSWFRLSVGNGTVPGAALGVLSSHPGYTAAALQSGIPDATAFGGVVLVQAGTNDLLLAKHTPAQAAADVEALERAVAATGVHAVLVSVPPSAPLGPATNQLNALLKDWAAGHDVPWLDVTSAVTEPDGTWRPGLSTDGIHANDSGGPLMAAAVREQLPPLLRKGD